MKNRQTLVLCLMCALAAFVACGCGAGGQSEKTLNAQEEKEPMSQASGRSEEAAAAETAKFQEEGETINGLPLRDNELLYAADDETSVVTMYLTVRRGNEAEGTNHSWQEINSYSAYDYDAMGVDRYQVEGLLQVGDENGPLPGELGYGEKVPNATIQIRGQTSSRYAQKNYKIRLKDNKGFWRDQQTISLNKHMLDGLRFRNKMAYDLIKGIPQMVALRTQFVHLYVKDETGGEPGEFKDYGLYTQVEQFNKRALRAHGLDRNGHLYKINFFEFYRYEDVIVPVDDPRFDEKAFSELLECKGNTDHTKLIRMLEDVNDYSLSTDDMLARNFNTENLAYWMAYHILTGNTDTQSRNCYLYSPQNSETWYLISWDNDDSFMRTENAIKGRQEGGGWNIGVSNYWGNELFNRCLKSEEFRKQLDAAIQDLRGYLSEERLTAMVETYAAVTKPYQLRMPDQEYAPLTPENYDRVMKGIPTEVGQNYQLYLDSYEKPQPFFIGLPEPEGGVLKIRWDVSYDFQAEDIIYTGEVSANYDMSDPIAVYQGMWPEMETDALPPGQYFVRVTARDSSGNEQYAFDYYVTERGKEYGIKCFYVLPDGTIGEDIYEE